LANLLQNYQQNIITRADYYKLLRVYALTHRKNGKPYIAEAANPDTGSFEGHDSYNHSEHYFHSGFNDLIITGLVGLKPRADDVVEIDPLAPAEWDFFALDDVSYHGQRLAIVWDKSGTRYQLGAGLHVLADGKPIGSSPRLAKLSVQLPAAPRAVATKPMRFNYAVNNDSNYFPRVTASFVNPKSPLSRVNDGNYWYHLSPPNRWTCAGSSNSSDWLAVDFGTVRRVDTIKLYFLDDGEQVVAPASFQVELWNDKGWQIVPGQVRTPAAPVGHCANTISVSALDVSRLRVVFNHGLKGKTGLTEFEAWGPGTLPYTPAPPPK
jgi:hypothetical protein